MTVTNFQPSLPAPSVLNEQELNFLDDSPPGLFAENQNSNIGLKRKIFSDQMKEVSDQIATLWAERFVSTASQTLDQWEEEVGLPINPSGLTTQQRRARILARRQKGPFTRARRQQIVETYLLSTFGLTTQLTLQGAILTAGGLPLYSDATSLVGLYTITEDVTNFHYTVTINSSAQIDQQGIQRELEKVTPAGISFNITYSIITPPTQTISKTGGGRSVASSNGTLGSGATTQRSAAITWASFTTP